MTRYLIIILYLCIGLSCNLLPGKPKQVKDFYTEIAGWDIKYVPIIPPFRALNMNTDEWLIQGQDSIMIFQGPQMFGSIPVRSFGVSKNYIYGETRHGFWFLFNTQTLLYSHYLTEQELDSTLKKYKLVKNRIDRCDNYFQQLTQNKRCYWYPKIGEEYPTFEEIRPGPVYHIIVDGKYKVKGFKVKEKISITISKIYYFTIKYDNDKNELLYVSFDSSPPRLISSQEIYSGYAAYSDSLDITIYIPDPVAEAKGISEKDRVVISKKIPIE